MKKLNTKLRFLPVCMVLLFLLVQTIAFDMMSDSFIKKEAERAIDAEHTDTEREDAPPVLPAQRAEIPDSYKKLNTDKKDLLIAFKLYRSHKKRYAKDPDGVLYRTVLGKETYYYKIYGSDLLFVYTQDVETYINNIYLVFLVAMLFFAVFVQITCSGLTGLLRRDFTTLREGIDRLSHDEEPGTDSLYNEEFAEIYEVVRQMANDLAEAEESEKRFFQNASHELRTPLMSIQGYAEGLELGIFEDPRKALLVIREAEKNMSTLIEELLLLSQVDLENMPDEMTDIRLNELVQSAIAKLEGVALQKGITLRSSLQQGLAPIQGNRAQLERSITNLLTNALRYAKSEIDVKLYAEGRQYLIDVSDDGPGIREKDLPHVFERFYKGSKGSFGIGLSLSLEIIKRCRGTIEAQNTAEGARFRIRLPAPEKRRRYRKKGELTL